MQIQYKIALASSLDRNSSQVIFDCKENQSLRSFAILTEMGFCTSQSQPTYGYFPWVWFLKHAQNALEKRQMLRHASTCSNMRRQSRGLLLGKNRFW